MYANYIKRLLDFLLSISATIKRVFEKSSILEDTSKGEPNFAEERRLKSGRKQNETISEIC